MSELAALYLAKQHLVSSHEDVVVTNDFAQENDFIWVCYVIGYQGNAREMFKINFVIEKLPRTVGELFN